MTVLHPQRIRMVITLTAFILLLWFIYTVRAVLTPFVMGFVIAYILDPLVDLLENRRIPRGLAIVLVYLLIAGTLALVIFYVLPLLMRDLNQMVVLIPQYTENIQNTLRDMQIGYHRVPIPDSVRQVIDETIGYAESILLSLVQGLVRAVVFLFNQAFNLILAPILSYYFLKEFNRLGEIILSFIPVRYRTEVVMVAAEINRVIKSFIRGNLTVALLVGLLAAIGMYLIGMDFPILIGLLVGITNFIPYFGAIIAAVPAILLALLKSRWMALSVLGVMLIVQQLEGNIISPNILGNCVGLHPLVLIFVLLVGGQLWGIAGMVVAVPLAAILKILIKHLYWHLV